ncbi:hypothetical protein [Winogradskyella schleiferi]|uniref:hypothetical protein n=1 Tax=Winogradskyella schleiferi TaxID=2686078 RepID=UPI0015C19512|nr:hypothetical protein [Winogradskyella schleiferi]
MIHRLIKKVSEVNLLIILFVFIYFTGYAQSDNDVINSSIIIPLKIGKNPNTLFEKLVIEPANLFIQSNTLNNNSPHIQLELNLYENNTKYSTFLWCYDVSNESEKVNYPKAYQNYSFTLEISKKEVALVVEKLDFGKTMFIDFGQTAVIGNLEIQFADYIGERSEDINGNQTDAFNYYTILLSVGGEQKTVSFMSLNKHKDKKLIIEWKNYKISILEDSEKALKLIVGKNNS